jgi:hypothetical protein
MEFFVQLLAEVLTGANRSSGEPFGQRLLIAAVVAAGTICVLVVIAAGSAAGS